VFLSVPQAYMRYVEVLIKTYNAGDRTFYDAITPNIIDESFGALKECREFRTVLVVIQDEIMNNDKTPWLHGGDSFVDNFLALFCGV